MGKMCQIFLIFAPHAGQVVMMMIVKTAEENKYSFFHAVPFHISLTFCDQNMCRILIKICAEYCSIFHGEYSRAAGYFANTSFLLHPHFVSGPLALGASTMCINASSAMTSSESSDRQASLTPILKLE